MENQNEMKVDNCIVEKNKTNKRVRELEEENYDLKEFVRKEIIRSEKLKAELLQVFKELDTVGIIHGAGSKARAKEKLTTAMKNRYGEQYWNKVIYELEPDEPANSPARPEDKPATEN